jgi:hypothetical protein
MMHPIAQLLDAVASTGSVTDADIDEIVKRSIDPHAPGEITASSLRSSVSSSVRSIIAAHKVGNSGEARRIAREASASLVPQCGPVAAAASPPQSAAEVVAAIPRGLI